MRPSRIRARLRRNEVVRFGCLYYPTAMMPAHAALAGRVNVSCDDVRHVALPVLRHRILASFTAEAEGITTDSIVERLLKEVRERATS